MKSLFVDNKKLLTTYLRGLKKHVVDNLNSGTGSTTFGQDKAANERASEAGDARKQQIIADLDLSAADAVVDYVAPVVGGTHEQYKAVVMAPSRPSKSVVLQIWDKPFRGPSGAFQAPVFVALVVVTVACPETPPPTA